MSVSSLDNTNQEKRKLRKIQNFIQNFFRKSFQFSNKLKSLFSGLDVTVLGRHYFSKRKSNLSSH